LRRCIGPRCTWLLRRFDGRLIYDETILSRNGEREMRTISYSILWTIILRLSGVVLACDKGGQSAGVYDVSESKKLF